MLKNPPTLAEQTVPRYTSYPTAPHFTAAVDANVYTSWLSDLPDQAALSLYTHVPFCAVLCHYCGCHTQAARRREPIEAYARQLEEELALVAERTGRKRVRHVHWGGGTPSMLGPERLLRLTNLMREAFDFSSIREHAFELDPRHVRKPLVRALVEIGVNRASLGVQDFSHHVQQAIGRIQPLGIVADAVATLRDAGIDKINIDLMYGLPKQTERDVRRSIALADSLRPQRLALFGYAHVPWFKANQRLIDETALPGPEQRLAQAETARETLISLGYVPIGLDHFARPDDELARAAASGRLHRNFQGYTTDEADALVGFGASSISKLPQGFAQNAADVGAYSEAISARRLATVKGIAFSSDDRLRARIIERLMCDFAVDVEAVASQMGQARIEEFDSDIESLTPLKTEGVLEIAGRRVAMTEKGRPFVRLAAAAFDAYFKRGQARHSAAV